MAKARSSLEDVKLGQALLKFRFLTATRLLELTRSPDAAGGASLREILVRAGTLTDATARALLDGTWKQPAKPPPAPEPPAALPAPPPLEVVLPQEPALATPERAFTSERTGEGFDRLFGDAPTPAPSASLIDALDAALPEPPALVVAPAPVTENLLDTLDAAIPEPPAKENLLDTLDSALPETPAAVIVPSPRRPLAPTRPPPPDTGFQPFTIDEHFLCQRALERNDTFTSYEVLHLTEQHAGTLFLLEPGATRGTAGAVVLARAEIMEDMRNPCVQRILGHGTWENGAYWVEEQVAGTPLRSFLAQGPLPGKSTASILADVAEALAEANQRGLTHDGLDLDAIVIAPSGRPRLLAFCRPDRPHPQQAGRNGESPAARKDVAELLGILRSMVDGIEPGASASGKGGRPGRLDPKDPLERSLAILYQVAGQTQPARRYASAARLAADLRTAISGERIYPPGTSQAWRVLTAMARWFKFSWLLGIAVSAAVIGFFGNEQYRKWRDIQASTAVDTSIPTKKSAMEPYLKRGRERLEHAKQALATARFPEAGKDLRDAVKEFDSAVALEPLSYLSHAAYMGRAEAHLLQGAFNAAVADSDLALQVKPAEAEANYLRALGLLAEHHAKAAWVLEGRGAQRRLARSQNTVTDTLAREALRSLEECLRAGAGGQETLGWRGAAAALHAFAAGKDAEALPLLRDLCAREPAHRVAHEAQLFLLTARPPVDVDGALGVANHLIDKVPDHLRAYALRAELWLLKENFVRAQDDVAEAIRRSPAEGWLHEIEARVDAARGLPAQALQALEAALRLSGDSAAVFATRGRIQRKVGRLDLALADLERAAALDPGHAGLRLEVASVLEELGRPEDAAGQYALAVECDKTRSESWVGQVRCRLATGDPGAAGPLIQQAVEAHSGVAGLALALGIYRCSQKDYRGAIRSLDKALDLARGEADLEPEEGAPRPGEGANRESGWSSLVRYPCPPAGIYHVRAWCQLRSDAPDLAQRDWTAALELDRDFLPGLAARCELVLSQGQAREALVDARRLASLLPDQPGVLVLRARVLERMGDYGGAKADLDAALAIAPQDAQALTQRGIVQQERGDLESAVKDFDRAISLSPQSARPWACRASAEAASLNPARAREDYETALSLDPKLPEAHLGLARLATEAGRPKDAVALLDRAIRAVPDDPSLLAARAALHVKLGNFEAALRDYDAAVALHPRDAVLVTNRGVTYQSLGKNDLALADYTRAVDLDADFAPAWLNRGMLNLTVHRLDDARKDLDRALEIRPDYAEAFLARAHARKDAGQSEEALLDYSAAIRCKPNSTDALIYRAILYVQLGRDEKARADLERALRLDPGVQSVIAPELKKILQPRK